LKCKTVDKRVSLISVYR